VWCRRVRVASIVLQFRSSFFHRIGFVGKNNKSVNFEKSIGFALFSSGRADWQNKLNFTPSLLTNWLGWLLAARETQID